ncbi:MAG: hypothetical protein LH616_09340 [Ilumatobacteraceae bacterium]|nr:hypothetical protein [Ilumatobacteraceae bacterium]
MIRRALLTNRVPDVVGGGTVAYVNPTEHRFLDDPVHREEGGTPAIIESIRAGMVFQLKQAVGVPPSSCTKSRTGGVPLRRGRPTLRCRCWATPTPSVCPFSRSWSSGRASVTCTTTSWLRCSATFSASSRAGGAHARALTATDCWASTLRVHTSSSTRSLTAAKASSPAGRGSASTTSSPRRSSSTSSMRSIWSQPTAGSCFPRTASTRRMVCGAITMARWSRRCDCRSCRTTLPPAICVARRSTAFGRPSRPWPAT